jgi:hypothetical protein
MTAGSDTRRHGGNRAVEGRWHVRAALTWLVAVAVVQVVFTYLGHQAMVYRWSTLGEVIDVSPGPPIRWTSGFPLAAGEVTCDRTMWTTYLDVSRAPGEPQPSQAPHLECPPDRGSVGAATRSTFSSILLVADVLLTAIPLGVAAALAGGRYPFLVLPGLLLALGVLAAVPWREGIAGAIVSILAWLGAVALMPAIAAGWRRLRGPGSVAVPPATRAGTSSTGGHR